MDFYITSSEIEQNIGAASLFNELKKGLGDREGFCYYKYPLAGSANAHLPDIVIIDSEYGVVAIDIYSSVTIDDLENIDRDFWVVNGETGDSPYVKLEDYQTNLTGKFQKYRPLRNKVTINPFIIFPAIKRKDFEKKFPTCDFLDTIIFDDYLSKQYNDFWPYKSSLAGEQNRRLFLSVAQGAGRLNEHLKIVSGEKAEKVGDAIKLVDTKISLLDKEQHAAAIQIPDGPQRIRGMAGTGKTIILTMKAAFLHSKFPDKKILYTFHTQSLYNLIRNLITKFYRDSEEKDPNWDNLLILHSWGGKTTGEGVYYRACLRNSVQPMSFQRGHVDFSGVCTDLLGKGVEPEYDFVLMDEAQDFPPSFFQLVYELTHPPKRVIFAYDELQSLTEINIADTGELFGYNLDGSKKVDFSKGTYKGGIEMDYVLKKSYRNPLEVLMAAHSLGLGLYNKAGIMQIIDSKEIWESIGYKVVKGVFKKVGEEIIIERPTENSVSLANEIYNGSLPNFERTHFDSRQEEFNWIADKIEQDVKEEGVQPHDIIVISLNARYTEEHFTYLQKLLFQKRIPSIIPGIGGIARSQFGEKGFVTLSTVFKAKGNEAYIVYVAGFDYLYDYVDFITSRNKAFTSITRSKGWCRITGVGEEMKRAIKEIDDTLALLPKFRFNFPDPKHIARKLSQEEHAKRQQERLKGTQAVSDLLSINKEAIKLSDGEKEELRKKLGL